LAASRWGRWMLCVVIASTESASSSTSAMSLPLPPPEVHRGNRRISRLPHGMGQQGAALLVSHRQPASTRSLFSAHLLLSLALQGCRRRRRASVAASGSGRCGYGGVWCGGCKLGTWPPGVVTPGSFYFRYFGLFGYHRHKPEFPE
jgi:hypothetical protein